MKHWFEFKNLTDGSAEVMIFGTIGWEVSAGEFVRELGEITADQITVRVNSPGGDVYEGLAIMNALRGHDAEVTVIIEGLAASAASFIAVGGADRVICRPNAELMIHEAWTFAEGNAGDLEKTLADLNRISANLANIYADKAGGDPSMWRGLMQAETWFSADEALEAGLVDEVTDARPAAKQLAGTFNLARFKYTGRAAAPPPAITNTHKEKAMSVLANLAKELGKDPEVVRNALDRYMNEEVTVTTTVELAYPEGVSVVPTGKVTVTPQGEVPAGLIFAVGDAPEGWGAEVDEATGVVTLTAPSGVDPDDQVQIVVTAQGNGDPVEFPVTVTVKSAAADDDDMPPAAPAAAGVGDAERGLTEVVDAARLAELERDAAYGRMARAREKKSEAERLVDAAIADGKIGAAAKARWIEAMNADPDDAKARLATIRPGLVHRTETGHTHEPGAGGDDTDDPKYTGLVNAFGLGR